MILISRVMNNDEWGLCYGLYIFVFRKAIGILVSVIGRAIASGLGYL